MTNSFAALPGHAVIIARKRKGKVETVLVPVIGWAHLTGAMAHPLTVMNHGAITGYKATLHPSGEVSDMALLKVFASSDDWLAAVDADIPTTEESKPKPVVEPVTAPLEIEPELPPLGPVVGVSGEKVPEPTEKPAKPKRTRKAAAAAPEPETAPGEPAEPDYNDLI